MSLVIDCLHGEECNLIVSEKAIKLIESYTSAIWLPLAVFGSPSFSLPFSLEAN